VNNFLKRWFCGVYSCCVPKFGQYIDRPYSNISPEYTQ